MLNTFCVTIGFIFWAEFTLTLMKVPCGLNIVYHMCVTAVSLPLGSRIGFARIFVITIVIPIHPIEKNRNRNRARNRSCE